MSVLILGAGLVVEPLVRFLSQGYRVTLASRTLANVKKITDKYPQSVAVECDVQNRDLLDRLVSEHDVVISMLPYIHHKIPFRLALDHGKHFLSTSYTQDHMLESIDEVIAKNIVVVNEAGIYPGCETASIMNVVDELKEQGYKVESLTTFCGGVPSPSANTNPFGYKFSWAPRGVLLAERNGATYLEDGEVKTYETRKELLDHTFWEDFGGDIGKLEGIANRDSIKFLKLYGIEDCKTFVRGSLRYPGWSDIIRFYHDNNLLDICEDRSIIGKTYREILSEKLGCDLMDIEGVLKHKYSQHVVDAVNFLDLCNPELVVPDNLEQTTLLDAMTYAMNRVMQYKDGEKDMIAMVHRFTAVNSDGQRRQVVTKAVFYGNENGTAMENTVSLPVAVVADLILSGKYTEPGVHILNKPELYEPVLDTLSEYGYDFLNMGMSEYGYIFPKDGLVSV